MQTRIFIPGIQPPSPWERAKRTASLATRCIVTLVAGAGAAAIVIALGSGVSLSAEVIFAAVGG